MCLCMYVGMNKGKYACMQIFMHEYREVLYISIYLCMYVHMCAYMNVGMIVSM